MTSARTGACSFAHSTTFWVFAGTIHDALNAHQQSISSIVILTCACVTLHLHIFTHHPSPLAQGAGCQASDPASRWPGCDLQARGAAHHRPHTHPYRCPNVVLQLRNTKHKEVLSFLHTPQPRLWGTRCCLHGFDRFNRRIQPTELVLHVSLVNVIRQSPPKALAFLRHIVPRFLHRCRVHRSC